MKRRVRAGLMAVASFCVVHSKAADAVDVIVARTTDLREDRYSDAPTIRMVARGTHAELLVTEAGWVHLRVDGGVGWVRASSLAGDAAGESALARLETGRSVPGNIVVAAGIRRIPKASKHALIVGIEAGVVGVGDDVESARMMVARAGVPDDNIEVVRGVGTFEEIGRAIDRLNDRVQSGDQVFVYYAGPGTQVPEGAACVAAWRSGDGQSLSARTLVSRLRPTLTVADKVMFISDSAYSPDTGRPDDRGRGMAGDQPRCAVGSRGTEMPIVDAAVTIGVSVQNIVHLQPAVGPTQGMQQIAGGLFTQALADCWLGDAIDLDRSGSISVSELASCIAASHFGRRLQPASQPASVTGNAAFSPLVGIASSAPAASVAPVAGSATARAAIDDVYAQRDNRIAVQLTASSPALRIGQDALDLRIGASRAGYVYLVLLGSDGKSFSLLFPNDLDRDNRISASETLRLPRPAWRVQAQGPAGHDLLLAIVAESERDLAPLAAHKDGPFGTALTDADGRAQLQWLLGRSGRADSDACVDGGRRRNLAAVKVCSDAFGAALLDIVER